MIDRRRVFWLGRRDHGDLGAGLPANPVPVPCLCRDDRVLTLILCYPVAFWVSRLSERWGLVFKFLITLPFVSSLIVRLYSWLLILKPSGILNTVLLGVGAISEPLETLYTPAAVVLGMVYVMVPACFCRCDLIPGKLCLRAVQRWGADHAVQAIEEAVVNALVAGEDVATVESKGLICRALDRDRLKAILGQA